jgi:uncharacterized protein
VLPNSAKYLLIGSTDAYSGKSAGIIGLIPLLQNQGKKVAYAKPLGTLIRSQSSPVLEEDVQFIQQVCHLSNEQVRSPILFLDHPTITNKIKGHDTEDYANQLQTQLQSLSADLVLLEGPATLWEGSLFNLSTVEMAQLVNASILLVVPYSASALVDSLLTAQRFLGDHLLGVLINQIPEDQLDYTHQVIAPFLESNHIPVLGMLPKDRLLHSLSVREIARRLDAKVLCREDRLDLMVESLTIGAMNVNSALEYFRQRDNMAVVTGGDRTELQLAALETSTQCLILTGRVAPQPLILSRAEDLEIPILAVNYDTLTTVEIIDNSLGKVRLQEPIKVQQVQEIMSQYFDVDRLLSLMSN